MRCPINAFVPFDCHAFQVSHIKLFLATEISKLLDCFVEKSLNQFVATEISKRLDCVLENFTKRCLHAIMRVDFVMIDR